MSMSLKTVLFGPFIGEFGWELLYWQGWVRKACRTIFKDYHKIAASFPGRYTFYPDVDEFWEHPQEIIGRKHISSKGYTTDNWFAGLLERGENQDVDKDSTTLWEGSVLLQELTEYYQKRLPDNAVILSPANWIDLPGLQVAFGTQFTKNPDKTYTQKTVHIKFNHQILEEIKATDKGTQVIKNLVAEDVPLIALFPRARMTRRLDKNWPQENYSELIQHIRQNFPEITICILGEPGGAYFADGIIPEGCIDLININPDYRMDTHVAALNQAIMAIGSMSGATLFALAAGTPTLHWGPINLRERIKYENYLNTDTDYYPFPQPSTKDIITLADYWLYRHGYGTLRRIKPLSLFYTMTKANLRIHRYNLNLKMTRQKDQVHIFK